MSLKFAAVCLQCNEEEKFELNAATFFNKFVDYIADCKEEIFFCHRICRSCKNFIYVDLKKNFNKDRIKKIFKTS